MPITPDHSENEKLRQCKAYLKEHAVYVRCPLVDEHGKPMGEYSRHLYVTYPAKNVKAAQAAKKLVLNIMEFSPRYSGQRREMDTPLDGKPHSSDADHKAYIFESIATGGKNAIPLMDIFKIDMRINQFERDIAPHVNIIEPTLEEIEQYYREISAQRTQLLKETGGQTIIRESEAQALEKKYPELKKSEFFLGGQGYIDPQGNRVSEENIRTIPGIGALLDDKAVDYEDWVKELLTTYGIEEAVYIQEPHKIVNWLADIGSLMENDVQNAAFGLPTHFTLKPPASGRVA